MCSKAVRDLGRMRSDPGMEMIIPGLTAVEHVVMLMLENRSFDHPLGYLYADAGNVSPAGSSLRG
jgi:phospholipase C